METKVIDGPPPRRGQLRFSVRTLLVLTGIVAGLLALWQAYCHARLVALSPHYEHAIGTRGSFQIGPHEVRVQLVARNDRDGTLKLEDGRVLSRSLTEPPNYWVARTNVRAAQPQETELWRRAHSSSNCRSGRKANVLRSG